jgi:hypothetical protein
MFGTKSFTNPKKYFQNHIGGSVKPKVITKGFFQNQQPNNTNINYEHMSITNVRSLIA